MKLSVGERYVLLEILPNEGTFTTLKILRSLQENLSFSEGDVKINSIKELVLDDGRINVTWDTSVPESEVPIGERGEDLIVTALKQLDKDGKLTQRHFSVYEKFVEHKETS